MIYKNMKNSFVKIAVIFTVLFLFLLCLAYSAFAADMPPADKISWGMNKVYSSVASSPGNQGTYWMSSFNLVNPLNYDILIQFSDIINNRLLKDLIVISGEQIKIKNLISYLELPDGVYAINVMVRAASIDDVLAVSVNVFTYTLKENGGIQGCSLPEKKYFGKTAYVIPFDFNPNARKALYILAINDVHYDIFWFNDTGMVHQNIEYNIQGLNRFPVPNNYTYALIVNKVPYVVNGFSKEPEIYCYSTSTDNTTQDTQILVNN